MRALDGLAKALGVLLLLAVLVLVPLVGVAQRSFQTLYDAPTLAEAVETYWLGETALTRLAQGYAREQLRQTPSSDKALLLWRALNALNANQWQTLMGYLAPRQAVHQVILQGSEAAIAWLRTPGAPPEVEVVLTPWKQAVEANATPFTTWLLGQFRECNLVETGRWAEAAVLNNWALPPLCVPLGTSRQMAEQVVASALRQGLQAAPERVNLLDPNRVPVHDLEAARAGLLQARRGVTLALMVVVFLWVVGLALVSRSWAGLFQAIGVTLLLAGGSLALMGLTEHWLAAWMAGQAASQVPAWAQASLQSTMAFYAHRILQPLALWGSGMAVGGVMAFVVALVLQAGRRRTMRNTLGRLN